MAIIDKEHDRKSLTKRLCKHLPHPCTMCPPHGGCNRHRTRKPKRDRHKDHRRM